MNTTYTLVTHLEDLIGDIPPQSIISRAFYHDARLKALLFGFDAGQALSEHTASQAAIIHILSGKARVTLGDDCHELDAGAWAYLPPRLKHSVYAHSALRLLLLLIGD